MMVFFSPKFLEKRGLTNTILYKVATLSERTGGRYRVLNLQDDPLRRMDKRIAEVSNYAKKRVTH